MNSQSVNYTVKKYSIAILVSLISISTSGQLPLSEAAFFEKIKPGNVLPENLLSTKTAVFYPVRTNQKELDLMQRYFSSLGVDAVAYIDSDHLIAGRDLSMATAAYLNRREIENIIVVQKTAGDYTLTLAPYNHKTNFIEPEQTVWRATNSSLEEILKQLNREASYSLKRNNLLINDIPETVNRINPISGRRNEFFALDLKVDMLAVPKFNDEQLDKELEAIMASYPFKYTLTDPNTSEADLRKQGMLFVLRFAHAGAKLAKRSLGYDVKDSESAVVSITYPRDDQPVLSTIPSDAEVFKFYFKHIDSGNVFLGTKWDADRTWQAALWNQLRAFRKELNLN